MRTNVPAAVLDALDVVLAYQRLSRVERNFRGMKDSLDLRPMYVLRDHRIRGHVLLCMLAYRLEMEVRRALAPTLFADEALPSRTNPVAPAQCPAAARRQIGRGRTEDGIPLRAFREVLEAMTGVAIGRVHPVAERPELWVPAVHVPEPSLEQAFELLECGPRAKPLVMDAQREVETE